MIQKAVVTGSSWKIWSNLTSKYSEPDKSMIYSSTLLIERTDQTTSIAGQLWIWRQLDESSRHLHKLFILPYFTAAKLSIISIFRHLRQYCAVVLFGCFDSTVQQHLLWPRCLNPLHQTVAKPILTLFQS